MILMLFLTPFTRAVMGTSIGASAANLPLTVAAAPFVARMVEQSLEEVDGGVIEAARCMGATNWQIITRVLLVESVPSLLRGLTISTITVFGYTAITGATGAGGLGNIAFRFGYQRYQQSVMYASLALVIVVVCVIHGVWPSGQQGGQAQPLNLFPCFPRPGENKCLSAKFRSIERT